MKLKSEQEGNANINGKTLDGKQKHPSRKNAKRSRKTLPFPYIALNRFAF